MEAGHSKGKHPIKSIVILGNCQGEQLAQCLVRMLPEIKVEFVRYFSEADVAALASRGKRRLVLVQNPIMSFGEEVQHLRAACEVIDFPTIAHGGFHPDLIRPKRGNTPIQGPLGSNHSAIALYGYLRGLTEDETIALFREDVFRTLGYFSARAESDLHLTGKLAQFGLFDEAEFAPVLAGPCFMHNTIHPKLPVISALARAILGKAGIEPALRFPENLMADALATNVVWPIYPEIAREFGLAGGEYIFQFKGVARHTFGLAEFVARSFAACAEQDVDATCHPRFASGEMAKLDTLHARPAAPATNPYRAYPPEQFWRRAVAAAGHGGIDPVVQPDLRFDDQTRIGTAGSCFAQHIARRLAASGHRYLVTEAGDGLDEGERKRRNFGVYSARYGNVYTARQMRQLVERAEGAFQPSQSTWRRTDGRFVDPFRPEIEPDGFGSPEDVAAAREEHLASVRRLLREVDVLVFTLGLTEAWVSPADGAVYPLCPMVAADHVDSAMFAPVNFSHAEVVDDLMALRDMMLAINPAARILLTVSPVPLIATFEPRHVLVSTTASKSILRAAADEVCRKDAAFTYFPSYEIVANPFFAVSYFDPADARSVLPQGVDHVMRVFMKHHSALDGASGSAPSARKQGLAQELDDEQRVVCEEERLDP